MLRTNLPTAVRHLRRRRGWRQSDLAARADVSRQVVSRLERGELRGIALGTIRRIIEALEASVDGTVRWRGEELERLIDSAHAALVERSVATLAELGWSTRVEVSFNHFGDRGRVDILALHATSGTLLVVEVKSAIGNEEATLGQLDVKARLGSVIAREVGWPAAVIVPALVIGDARTARRIVRAHAGSFARFELRGRQAIAWLRRPRGPAPSGLLLFMEVPDCRGVSVTRSARVRTA
ncbi:MAG TPA: helix-turn-helix transcriptional regulator [Candidatus Limnocylindria bacterium]|nr:helix-turn-helix transcriptional regulator [Candidatus Limnocylindria bacterium]